MEWALEPGRRWVSAGVLMSALLLLILGLTGRDISSRRFLASDVLLRSGMEQIFPYRFSDCSPYGLWLPSDTHVRRSIRSGELPLWDRRQGGGYSPFTSFYSGVFFPLRWAVALFPEKLAQSALLICGLLATWCGAFLLFWKGYEFSEGAAAFGASMLTFSGGTLAAAQFTGSLCALVMLPWVLISYLEFAARPTHLRFLALTACLTLLLAAGHPSVILIIGLTVVAAVLGDFLFSARPVRTLLLASASAVAALLLGAFFIVPLLQQLPHSWSYKVATTYGATYEPVRTVFWQEEVFALLFAPSVSAPFEHIFFYGFLGLSPLLLTLAGMAGVGQRKNMWHLLLWIPLAYMLSFPGVDPVSTLLTELPFVRFTKGWYLFPLFIFPASLASAIGFDRIRAIKNKALCRALIFAFSLVAVVSWAIAAYRALPPYRWEPLRSAGLDFLRQDRSAFRVMGLVGQTHLPNIAELTGIEDVRIASPLLNERYHAWFELVDPRVTAISFPTTRIPSRIDSPLLGSFNVKYILQSRIANADMHSKISNEWKYFFPYRPARLLGDPLIALRYSDRFVEISENRRQYQPRAHFAEDIHVVEGGLRSAFRWMQSNPASLGHVFVVESPSPSISRLLSSHRKPLPALVEVSYPTDRKVTLRTRSEVAGLLVLHETFAEGWRASIDGTEATVIPVNLISRGVFVPAGRHEVVMRYVPPGVKLGAAISFAFLLLLLIPLLKGLTLRSPVSVTHDQDAHN